MRKKATPITTPLKSNRIGEIVQEWYASFVDVDRSELHGHHGAAGPHLPRGVGPDQGEKDSYIRRQLFLSVAYSTDPLRFFFPSRGNRRKRFVEYLTSRRIRYARIRLARVGEVGD